jgi:hypothetical protein
MVSSAQRICRQNRRIKPCMHANLRGLPQCIFLRRLMGESSNDNQRHQEKLEPGPAHRVSHHQRPYWQRAHRDWRFWVAVTFLFAALSIFILSDNLALVPRR